MGSIPFILLPDARRRQLALLCYRRDHWLSYQPTLRRTGISDAIRLCKLHARNNPAAERGEP
jgi:hypothetical protein